MSAILLPRPTSKLSNPPSLGTLTVPNPIVSTATNPAVWGNCAAQTSSNGSSRVRVQSRPALPRFPNYGPASQRRTRSSTLSRASPLVASRRTSETDSQGSTDEEASPQAFADAASEHGGQDGGSSSVRALPTVPYTPVGELSLLLLQDAENQPPKLEDQTTASLVLSVQRFKYRRATVTERAPKGGAVVKPLVASKRSSNPLPKLA